MARPQMPEGAAPCYICGAQLERRKHAEPGSLYPYRCPNCGGQCSGWFSASGNEHCDCQDSMGTMVFRELGPS